MSEIVKGILRAVSSGLQIPTIIILILLILLTIFMLGSFIAELVTERRTLKLNIPKLVDELQGKTTAQMKDVISSSSLLTRQKAALQELISRVNYPEDTREALARQLIADEEARYGRIIKITDLTARVAPMFGLMGTLIPLGPGLIALGEGDAATLSESLLIAFDTTVAGLISGALSYIVSGFRKGWYEEYMIGLETIMETVLDVQNTERGEAQKQNKPADAAKPEKTVPKGTMTMTKEQAAQIQGAQAAKAGGQVPRHTMTAQQMRTAAQGAQTAQAGLQQGAQAHAAAGQQAAQRAAQAAPTGQQAAAQMQQARMAAAQGIPQAAPTQAAAPSVTSTPTFAEANSRTVAGYDARQLQAEVRAAEEAMRRADAEAAKAAEMDQIQSLDDLLENFAPTDGRQ